ncbi:hypothetical protein TWF481_006240 [Arthrobotrys musiformis]|uniref:Uncharacterized protein n=1 Tax=Arthrobotrys musiformis TaxID=47236 RepID=A0AAV9WI48_9PEZI
MASNQNQNAAVMRVYNDKLIHQYENIKAKAAGHPRNTDQIDIESVCRIYREAVLENDKLRTQLKKETMARGYFQQENQRLVQALKKAQETKEYLEASYQAILNTNLALHNSTLCLSTQISAMQSKSEPGVDACSESQPPSYLEISPTSQAPTPLLGSVGQSPVSGTRVRCSISMLDNPLVEGP